MKLILVLVFGAAALIAGAFVARHVRRKILAERALAAGLEAFEHQDWNAACKQFQAYLARRPGDIDVLRKYAHAVLRVRPPSLRNLTRAVTAYRELIRLVPENKDTYRYLAALYTRLGDLSELGYIARKRLAEAPGDPEATLWLARSLIPQHKTDEGRRILVELVERLETEPDKRPEVVEACAILSELARRVDTDWALLKAVGWLDQAVAYDSESPDALLARARSLRTMRAFAGRTREDLLQTARQDLDRAEHLIGDDPRVTLLLSEEWMRHGDLDRAAKLLEAVRHVDEETVRKYFVDTDDWVISRFLQTAELSMRRGKAEEGAGEVDSVLSTVTERPKRLAVLPHAIRLFLTCGRTAKARQCLDEFTELRTLLDVKDGAEHHGVLKALVAQAEGKPEEAIQALRVLASGTFPDPRTLRLLGNLYSQTGRCPQACDVLQRYLQAAPGDGPMWLLLAYECGRRADWQGALGAARRAEALRPDDPMAALMRMEATARLAAALPPSDRQRPLSAISEELSVLREVHPDLPQVRSLQAALLLFQDRPNDAAELLATAVKKFPKSVDLRLALANAYSAAGLKERVLDTCRAACRDHPQVAATWLALAGLQQTEGRHEEARATLRRGLDATTDPRQRKILTVRAAFSEILDGDRQTGIKMLRESADGDPRDVEASDLLLGLPEVQGETEYARQLLDRIRQVQGERSRLWRRHQATFWSTNDRWRENWPEVASTLERWASEDRKWPMPALLLARLHERRGQPEKAEEICRQALTFNPSAIQVADTLIRLLQKQNRHADARRVMADLHTDPKSHADRLVDLSLGEGDLAAAVRHLKLQVANGLHDTGTLITLAHLTFLQARDLDAALAYLDDAEKLRPNSGLVLLARVDLLRLAGKTDRARELLDAQVAKNASPSAYWMRGRFLAAAGQKYLAEKDLLQVVKLDPSAGSYRLLADFYRKDGRTAEAERTLRRGLESHADNSDLARQLLTLLLDRKGEDDLAEAEKILGGLDRRYGELTDLLWARALLLMARSPDSSDAAEVLARLVRREPTFVPAHSALIDLALKGKDTDTALQQARLHLATALEANPGNASLLQARDRIRLWGELVAGEQVVKPVLAKARALERQGKPDVALAVLRAGLKTNRAEGNIAIMLALAGLHRRQGRLPEANRWLGHTARMSPDSLEVLKERLRILGAEGQRAETISLASAHEAAGEADASVLATAAAALAASGRQEDLLAAEPFFQRAVELSPDWASAKRQFAHLSHLLGKVDRAARLYREVLAADADDVESLNGLAWILAEVEGKHDEALRLVAKAAETAPRDWNVRRTRGTILSHMPGRLNEGRDELLMCLELSSSPTERAQVLCQLGRLCADLGRRGKARERFREAQEIDAEHHVLTEAERKQLRDAMAKVTPPSK